VAREVTTVIRSDLSGEIVPEERVVLVTFEFPDGRRNRVELDVGEWEIEDMLAKGREIKRRGRPKGSRNKAKDS
jgi:hypothetical protein